MNNEEKKICLNCKTVLTSENSTISGAGKGPAFCDTCMAKVMKFLDFVSKSESSAVENFKVNIEKLNRSGLDSDGLRYIYGFCRRLDEKRAAEKESAKSACETAPESAETQKIMSETISSEPCFVTDKKDPGQDTKIWQPSEYANSENHPKVMTSNEGLEQNSSKLQTKKACDSESETENKNNESNLNENSETINREEQRKRLIIASAITAAAFIIVIAVVSAVVLFGGKGGEKDGENSSYSSSYSSEIQSDGSD